MACQRTPSTVPCGRANSALSANPQRCVEPNKYAPLPISSSSALPRSLKPVQVSLRRKTTVIGTGQRVPSLFLFEWNPGNGKWYSINERSVMPKSLLDPVFVARYRDTMNRVLRGETVTVQAEYVPEHKMLLVKEV